jgi:hypothetical protein
MASRSGQAAGRVRRGSVGSFLLRNGSEYRTREWTGASREVARLVPCGRVAFALARRRGRMVEVLCRWRVSRGTRWKPSGCYGAAFAACHPGSARNRPLVGRYAAQPAASVGGQKRRRGSKPFVRADLAGVRPPSPGMICRVARGFCPDSGGPSPEVGPEPARSRAICRSASGVCPLLKSTAWPEALCSYQLSRVRLPSPGMICRVARGFCPGSGGPSPGIRPVPARGGAICRSAGGVCRRPKPAAWPKALCSCRLSRVLLPSSGMICRVGRGFCPCIGPLKGERMICRQRLRPLPRGREAAGRHKSLIQQSLWPGKGMIAGVICRQAGGVSRSLTLRLLCYATEETKRRERRPATCMKQMK